MRLNTLNQIWILIEFLVHMVYNIVNKNEHPISEGIWGIMNKNQWLLLVLANGKSLSPVKLQKSLFLISKEMADVVGDEFYTFVPYDFGPFDSEIYIDALELQEEGFVNIDNPQERGWRRYSLTDEGIEKAEETLSSISPEANDRLSDLVSGVKRLSFRELIRSIYRRYPEYRTRSVFQE